jgi:MFS family permease
MKPGVYQFLIGCFASLGSFLFGYDLGVIAEVVASKSFKSLFLQSNANSRSGTVVALFTGGCFVGAFAAGFADRLGRRGTILLACIIFVIGGIIQTAGVVISMLYIGRLIAGIGVGLLTVCARISPHFAPRSLLTRRMCRWLSQYTKQRSATGVFEEGSPVCSSCLMQSAKSLPLGSAMGASLAGTTQRTPQNGAFPLGSRSSLRFSSGASCT